MALLLRKKNIIHLESEVSSLLKSELTRFQFPIKLLYEIKDCAEHRPLDNVNFKVIFITPKRYLKKAYKRNLVRRRIKEAFRINQKLLDHYRHDGKIVLMAFIYVSSDVLPFKQIESAVVKLITDLK